MVRVKSIQLDYGDRMDMMTVEYETQLPQPEVKTVVHGSRGGNNTKRIELNNGEWINDVGEWQDGWALNNLRFGTTGGHQLLAKQEGTNAVLNWKKSSGNDYVVGFAGLAGGDVNDLDLLVLHFQPVNWVTWEDQVSSRTMKKRK